MVWWSLWLCNIGIGGGIKTKILRMCAEGTRNDILNWICQLINRDKWLRRARPGQSGCVWINKTPRHFYSPWNWSQFTYPDHIYHADTDFTLAANQRRWLWSGWPIRGQVCGPCTATRPRLTIPFHLVSSNALSIIVSRPWSKMALVSCIVLAWPVTTAWDEIIGKFYFIWGSVSEKVWLFIEPLTSSHLDCLEYQVAESGPGQCSLPSFNQRLLNCTSSWQLSSFKTAWEQDREIQDKIPADAEDHPAFQGPKRQIKGHHRVI